MDTVAIVLALIAGSSFVGVMVFIIGSACSVRSKQEKQEDKVSEIIFLPEKKEVVSVA